MWNIAVVSKYSNKIIGFEEDITGNVLKIHDRSQADRREHELNSMIPGGSKEYFVYVVVPNGTEYGIEYGF